jgi:hypothetical protein
MLQQLLFLDKINFGPSQIYIVICICWGVLFLGWCVYYVNNISILHFSYFVRILKHALLHGLQ